MATAAPARPPDKTSEDAVRVMVVDDSAVVRGLVARWLGEVPGVEVVSSQRTGKAALDALETADPDVVVLDIEMPEMDGLTALPLILKKRPSVVVIMASTLTRRNAEISLKAMALGARDYVAKPEGTHGLIGQQEFRRELAEKVLALGGRRRRSGGLQSRPGRTGQTTPVAVRTVPPPAAEITLRPVSKTKPRVLVIGSSTGGPPALTTVIKALSTAAATVPILIAQHMPPTFTAIMAEQLGRISGLPAAEGRHGEAVTPGRIYVAPGGYHMRIDQSRTPVLHLDEGPPINYCRPSVDPLFESAARIFGSATLALVLTGMGHDGMEGARTVADHGGTVIAQDEASSVVWGMPGAAARAGVCAAILPLDRIGQNLAGLITGRTV